jgi:hypothetical protein
MLCLPITPAWILSRVARRVYLGCAIASLGLIAIPIGIAFALAASGDPPLAESRLTVVLIEILLWPVITGTALLNVAMWYFWFSFDRSSRVKRTVWLVVLYMRFPIGSMLYYLFVYRRQQGFRTSSVQGGDRDEVTPSYLSGG